MSEMLDRVARAIGESYDGYADPKDTPNNWARAMSAAHAAIEAMREPTEEMVKRAAHDCATTDLATNDDFKRQYSEVWDSMIDAALDKAAA